MPRPKRKRIILNPPAMEGFKPFGIPMSELEPVVLLYEEYESIRLTDYEGLTQAEAAEKMNVSRPTLTRIYEKARQTIAQAFVEGKAILIEGGDYHSDEFWYRCENCLKINISDKELHQCIYCNSETLRPLNEPHKNGDIKGFCICIHCNSRVPHQKGVPCRETECPKCGKKMMREGGYHHQLYMNKGKQQPR